MNFKQYVQKQPLLEITEKSTLYWRSKDNFEVGDVIKSAKDRGKDPAIEEHNYEQLLEYYRQKNYPSKPSRFNCVYLSVVPRSVFLAKGQLYVVNPQGNTHITNASYIDDIIRQLEMSVPRSRRYDLDEDLLHDDRLEYYKEMIDEDRFEEEAPKKLVNLIDRYWSPSISQSQKKVIEVLADSAVIIDKIDESKKDIRENDMVRFTNDVRITWHAYYEDGNTRIEDEGELTEIIEYFEQNPQTKILKRDDSSAVLDLQIRIKEGTKARVKDIQMAKYKGQVDRTGLMRKYRKVDVKLEGMPENVVISLMPISIREIYGETGKISVERVLEVI